MIYSILCIIYFVFSFFYLTDINYRNRVKKATVFLIFSLVIIGISWSLPFLYNKVNIEYDIISPITMSDNFLKVGTDKGVIFVNKSKYTISPLNNNETPKLIIEYRTQTKYSKLIDPFSKDSMYFIIKYNL